MGMDQIKAYRRDLYVMLVVMNHFQQEAIAKGIKINRSLAMARISAQKAWQWTGKVPSVDRPSLSKEHYRQASGIEPIAEVTDVQFEEATGVFSWPNLGPLGFVSIDWRGLGNEAQKTMFLRKQIRKVMACWGSYHTNDMLVARTHGNLSYPWTRPVGKCTDASRIRLWSWTMCWVVSRMRKGWH